MRLHGIYWPIHYLYIQSRDPQFSLQERLHPGAQIRSPRIQFHAISCLYLQQSYFIPGFHLVAPRNSCLYSLDGKLTAVMGSLALGQHHLGEGESLFPELLHNAQNSLFKKPKLCFLIPPFSYASHQERGRVAQE